jgi:hypothetical protein
MSDGQQQFFRSMKLGLIPRKALPSSQKAKGEKMASFMTSRVTVPDDVLMRELDGESVILNLASEQYYGLDEVGTRMWQLLSTPKTIEDAYEILLTEYDVEPDRLLHDMQELIEQLVEHGLLQIEGDQSAPTASGQYR